jgi:serine/threonine protein kinase
MSDAPRPGTDSLPTAQLLALDAIRHRFEHAWRTGPSPRLEDYLAQAPAEQQSNFFAELLAVDLAGHRRAGEVVRLGDYLQRFPQYADLLRDKIGEYDTVNSVHSAGQHPSAASAEGPVMPEQPAPDPTFLGRYRILGRLGEGAFGIVYRGCDDELRRDVAIKVPHRHRIASPEDIEKYLHEARVVASLDYPHIVPVYDVGRTEGLCYVVSKFIDGTNLKHRLREGRVAEDEAVELIATIAQALHYAHQQGLVHRDVKPANLLLDAAGKPYLADFGMVLRVEDFGTGTRYAGTPVYMSPEQARGEGHRVDGRSDIFSLGVVFYEMLTGGRPFQAKTVAEVLTLIVDTDPRPPRQINDNIPRELERICLKAMARHPADRYTTARDLVEDLRGWQGQATAAAPPPRIPPRTTGWLKAVPVLLLLVGAIGVAVLWSGPGGSRPTTPLERVTSPGQTIARPGKEPTIRPLLWSKGCEVCKWEVLPETNQLKIYTDSTGLLQLGETAANSWEFSATLGQLAGVGRIGLFLGYRKDPKTSTAAFELIHLEVAGDKVYLQHSIETYRVNAPFVSTQGRTYASIQVKSRRENTIRLMVRANRLAEVWFNGEEIAGVANAASRSADGAFGIFNRKSDGVVSNLLFNDTPIPLLRDASPPVPEKP